LVFPSTFNLEEITAMTNQKNAPMFSAIDVTESDGLVSFGPLLPPFAKVLSSGPVPEIIPFSFTDQHADILADIASNERVLLTGHTGCGKTTALEQMAARLGVGVVVINMSEATDSSALLGSYVARKAEAGDQTSSTIFEDGPLVRAMKHGYWAILDEMDFAHPGVMTVLNGITSSSRTFLNQEVAGGEVFSIHENFRLMGTANTVGPMADFRHLYSGTAIMNPAQLERYRVHVIDYLPQNDEIKAVIAATKGKLQMISADDAGVTEAVTEDTARPFVKIARTLIEHPSIVYLRDIAQCKTYEQISQYSNARRRAPECRMWWRDEMLERNRISTR
jgi:midasin (ATPase involved in ribosome maturation)